MTLQENQYFEALSRDRSESAKTLEKPSMRGIKNSVVEKYSDQAHFIYELLQNADDAGATSARFILCADQLVFAHNGTKRFTVSNPDTEDEDSRAGKLGDINAITSIANSNKTEASIGKFCVGFKAVFQYTSTPHIYDPDARFRIDRFIVPSMLKEDYVGRQYDETVFVFPFDHLERSASEAFDDISDKLSKLIFPTLFLSNLEDIVYEFNNAIGIYKKNIKEKIQFGDTTAEYIRLEQKKEDALHYDNLWLFSRKDDCDRRYSVGFFLNDEGLPYPTMNAAFCFFPTKEGTGLNFLIHAPFLLTDSREGIRAGITHNMQMISLLATLAADSFEYLKEIGIQKNTRLINYDVLDLIPFDQSKFSDISDKQKISFKPFYSSIKDKFMSTDLLPASNSYVGTEHAYWAFVPTLTKLLSDEQLSDLTGNKNSCWVFTSIGRQDTLRKNKALDWLH